MPTNLSNTTTMPWFQEWLKSTYPQTSGAISTAMTNPALAGSKNLNYLPQYLKAPDIGNVGMASLLNILMGAGATSPALMNRTISGIAQGTQSRQEDLMGELARRGMMGSGVGLAAGQAIAQGGQNTIADVMANEAQMQEARRRQDLELMMNLFLQPRYNYWGTNLSGKMAQDQLKWNKTMGIISGLGNLFGGLGAMPGGGG